MTFWTAIGAIATVVAAIGAIATLFKISSQIKIAKDIAAYEFLRRESDRFFSKEMIVARGKLAGVLLLGKNTEKLSDYAIPLLDYFEDLGLLLRENLVPERFVWTMNCDYVIRYWISLESYIVWLRKISKDEYYYSEFEYLYKKMLKFEEAKKGGKCAPLTQDEINEFLEAELQKLCSLVGELRDEEKIKLRPFSHTDFDRIVGIENSSFQQELAYPKDQFEKLYKDHPDGFFVAEIFEEVVGYVIGYISNDIGELDSLAVLPPFRKLGIGRKLVGHILEFFKEKNIKKYSLEVCETSADAIHLYEELGFKIVETVKDYYGAGINAHRMMLSCSPPS